MNDNNNSYFNLCKYLSTITCSLQFGYVISLKKLKIHLPCQVVSSPLVFSVLAPVPLELDVAISVCIGYFQLLKLL